MVGAVEVKGADRLAATLHVAAKRLDDFERAAQQASNILVSRVQVTSPRETSRLANSFRADPHGGTAVAASDLIYGPVINGGWPAHGISPNPFIQRALDQAEPQVVALYLEDVDDVLGDVHGI